MHQLHCIERDTVEAFGGKQSDSFNVDSCEIRVKVWVSLCYSCMFEIFQNKKVKRFYSPLNWMSLKTRKGVDLGVKLPWFTSRLFSAYKRGDSAPCP